MKTKILLVPLLSLLSLFISVIPTFAAMKAEPVPRALFDLRGVYNTDLFTGSGTYSYTIPVPKGTNDLTPDVSISYDSSSTNNPSAFVGEGWDLSRDYVERDAILAALNVKAGDSLLGIDLQASRQRLEAIDWVASATVERRLPDTLYVTLKERRAVAIWQSGDEYTLIDRDGRTVRASRMPPGAETLLLLGGAGAPEHVGELLLLAYEPAVVRQLRAAVWVGQRRWNLILNNGVEIWLPEEDAVAALKQLAKLDAQHKLLSREFGIVDLRLPDKLYLKKRSSGEPMQGPA